MRLKDWLRLIRGYPNKDLNGRYIAYDMDSKPLGEVVYKEGKVVSKREYTIIERDINYN